MNAFRNENQAIKRQLFEMICCQFSIHRRFTGIRSFSCSYVNVCVCVFFAFEFLVRNRRLLNIEEEEKRGRDVRSGFRSERKIKKNIYSFFLFWLCSENQIDIGVYTLYSVHGTYNVQQVKGFLFQFIMRHFEVTEMAYKGERAKSEK